MTYQQHTTPSINALRSIFLIVFILITNLSGCSSCLNAKSTEQSGQINEQKKPASDANKLQSEQPNQQNPKPSNKMSQEATKKLFEAIGQGDLAGVNAFIQQGANMNATNAAGDPPLYLALRSNTQNPAIVETLINHGANTHFLNLDQGSLLYDAAISSKPEVFKVLLQSKAKDLIDHPDKNGLTALHRAIFSSHSPDVLKNMQLLLENGAQVNTQSNTQETPLLCATKNRDITSALLLLQYNANPNLKDVYENIPLSVATAANLEKLVNALLQKNANTHITDKYDRTPLHWATINMNENLVKVLIEHGANCCIQDCEGYTPLHLAIYKGDIEIGKLLLANGARASLNVIDHQGYTPLKIAEVMNRQDLVTLLLAEEGNS